MGLDAYIYQKTIRNLFCPDCGKFVETIEISREEVCYWRKNWDLHNFINDNIHEYGSDEYAELIELSMDDLIKIKQFIEQQRNDEYNNIPSVDRCISTLTNNPDKFKFYYSADW